MTSRLALRPTSTNACWEAQRCPAYAPGLQASQFIPTSGGTPSFVVAGFQQSVWDPGYNTPAHSSFTSRSGSITVPMAAPAGGPIRGHGDTTTPGLLPTLQGPSVGPARVPARARNPISSGYNTALNITNDYGMGTTPVGWITEHISGTTDQLTEAQAADNPSTANAVNQDTNAPSAPPPNAGQGLFNNSGPPHGQEPGRHRRPPDRPGTSNPSATTSAHFLRRLRTLYPHYDGSIGTPRPSGRPQPRWGVVLLCSPTLYRLAGDDSDSHRPATSRHPPR